MRVSSMKACELKVQRCRGLALGFGRTVAIEC